MSSDDPQASFLQSESTSVKTKWSLTQVAFDKLLNAFSSDRDKAAVQYEITRCKLVRFFQWRGIEPADEYADETLNRVARRIDQGQTIENLISYIYGVARMVFKEALKERERSPIPLDDLPLSKQQMTSEPVEPDARVLCLDRCMESLPSDKRQLIIDYYQEERRAKIELRQELADRLQTNLNALRIRAHRIRSGLEKCIINCLQPEVNAK